MGWAAAAGKVLGALAPIGGALIGRSGQNRAVSAQERATMAQIQLERDRDAARGARFSQAQEAYKAEKAQYDQIRRSLLEHYGVKLPAPAAAGPAPGEAHAMGGAFAAGAPAPGSMGGGMNLGQLMEARPPSGSPLPGQATPMGPAGPEGPQAPGVEGDDFDWRRYGVR